VEQVVDQSNDKKYRACGENDDRFAGYWNEYQITDRGSQVDRDASEHRSRSPVPAIRFRLGYISIFLRRQTDQQREQQRRDKAEKRYKIWIRKTDHCSCLQEKV
jgi:hypothetical protein